MQVFPVTFKILIICGFWKPTHYSTFIKKYLYNCYTFIMCFLVYSFTLSHLIDIIIKSKNFDHLVERCFMVLSMLNVCCKITNILYFRKDILQLLKLLISNHCKPNNKIEEEIQKKFYKKTKYVFIM
jgi:hypothetical protein